MAERHDPASPPPEHALPQRGDPLAAGVERAGLPVAVLETLTGWLMAGFQRDLYAGLEQAGDAGERPVPLARVLIDLEAAESPTREQPEHFFAASGALRRMLRRAARPVAVISTADSAETPDDIERKGPNGYLLIGGPGQGKTTIGVFACQMHRAALLERRRAELTEAQRELLQGFRADVERAGESGWPEHALLPIHMPLREFAAWRATTKPDTSRALFNFLAESISKRQEVTLDGENVRSLLAACPWFLVLDGLDEVPPSAGRDDMVDSIEGALADLNEAGAHGVLIGTTRPQGYSGELARLGLAPLHLTPMSTDRALRYAERFIPARYSHDADRAERTIERVRHAALEPAVARLLQTPLHVTIFAILIARLGRAPMERWQLFSRYYSIIYDREVERGGALAEVLGEHRRHIDQVHRRAGLLLQTATDRGEHVDAVLSRAELAAVIEQVLSEAGFTQESIRRSVDTLLQATSERLVFLAHRHEGHYGFELRSFQEMMAAWEIVHKSAIVAEARLHALVPMPDFRNVLLFAASREFAETSDIQASFVDLCDRYNREETHPLARRTLIGSRLALDLLEEGTVLGHPGHASRLAEIAARLVELPPDEVHVRLADLHGDRTEDAIRRAVEAALPAERVDAASVMIDGSWLVAALLAERGIEWARRAADRWWSLRERRTELLSMPTVPRRRAVASWLGERVLDSLDVLRPGAVSLTLRFTGEPHRETVLAVALLLAHTDLLPHETVSVVRSSGAGIGLMEIGPARPEQLPGGISWRSLASLTPAPSSWRPWVAFARYLQSPTKEGLAESLRIVAADFDVSSAHACAPRLPWPLGACLRAAGDAEALMRIADRAAAGDLGDAPDWEAAERRWREDGVPLDEIVEHDGSTPWGFKDGRLTFPVLAASKGETAGHGEEAELAAALAPLAEAFDRSVSPAARSLLAEIVWSSLSSCAVTGISVPVEILEPARWERWARATAGTVRLGALAVLAPLHRAAPPRDWRVFRSAVRAMGAVHHRSIAFKVAEDVRDVVLHHLMDDPGAHELWSILFFVTEHDWIGASASLRAVSYAGTDALTQAFYQASRLSLGAVAETDVAAAVEAVVAVSAVTRQPVVHLLGASYRSDLPLPLREQILQSLYTGLPAHRWYLRWWTMDSMVRLVRRRAERFDDQNTWDRLAFPLPRPTDLFRKTPSAPPAPPSPRITAIALENLRVFRRFELLATPPEGDSGQWLILLGPNGTGKTTLLRALALSMGDPDIAASLVRTGPRWLPEAGAAAGRCAVRTRDGDFDFQVETGEEEGVERLSPLVPDRAAPGASSRPVVYGYGCRRGSAAAGPSWPSGGGPLAQIATLFDEQATLVHAETWLQWLKAAAESQGRPEYYRQIERVVLATLTSLLPGVNTIEIVEGRLWFKGPAVGRVHLTGLSDGYMTMTGWIVDILARWTERAVRRGETLPVDFHRQMTGLVLLDEIDLHLHPLWQAQVIESVREIFPRMTFVVTTHNPLTILGARDGEIFVLRREEGGVVAEQVNLRKGAHADQILTGPWFGLESTVDPDTRGLLDEHRRLLRLRRRSPEQEARRKEVEAVLRDRLMTYADTSTERLTQSIAAEIILAREEIDGKSWQERDEAERLAIREEIKQRALAEERGGGEPASRGQGR